MSIIRRHLIATVAASALLAAGTAPAQAQTRKDSVVLGMVLEPTGLDPTTAPAAAIGEVVHYNVLEGLTKIHVDGSVTPLLAAEWSSDPDGKLYTFKLKKGITFQDGTPFDAATVKWTFERAKAEGSTNKAKKAVFDNISSIATPDAHTVIVTLNNADATLPFRLGENTAVILSPKSAATTATNPVGTGPFKLDSWQKGSAVSLVKWDGYRDAAKVTLKKVTFRFINDPAAQVAALLAGDIDGMPRFAAFQNLKQFQGDKRFTVEIGSTAGKGQLTINNKRKPFDDVRVRRAIAHAIDRKAFIDGVLEGLAKPIGSHAAPTDAGYVDLTGAYPYDPEKAKALLKEAGVATPLNVTLTLPPPQYARKGGEVVAAMLAKVGIVAKIENVEWAQWLSVPFKGNFDLTIINHAEPLDYMQYTNAAYYWGYQSKTFDALAKKHAEAPTAQRAKLYGDLQRQLSADAVNAWIFNPAQVAVAKKGLKGLWASSPIFANDMAAVSWQ
ncbi:ABC transporter substrate-binding protein [Aquincola sp. S2]|uniref:ABC transporter substrate-binding protein n=1 Tax=Pseudaquabacterium terrae TaxID=2732868 RepID=A0ABX2ELS6_9BURK|nr:ABC transporter substrate-binding protein [Aquabacterium terrae]NRF69506.1 ABC transporter substrate-binding protein [Aquabacterium terrae]